MGSGAEIAQNGGRNAIWHIVAGCEGSRDAIELPRKIAINAAGIYWRGRRGQKIISVNARRIYAGHQLATASAKITGGREKDGQKVAIFSIWRGNIASGEGIFRQGREGQKILGAFTAIFGDYFLTMLRRNNKSGRRWGDFCRFSIGCGAPRLGARGYLS